MKNYRFIVVVLACFALYGTYLSKIQFLEEATLSLFSNLLPAVDSSSKVAIIGVDQKSIEDLGPWPWSWKQVADLVTKLEQAGVSTIGMMLPLQASQAQYKSMTQYAPIPFKRSKDRKRIKKYLERLDPDAALVKSFKQSGNVILSVPYWVEGANLTRSPANGIPKVIETIPVVTNLEGLFSTLAKIAYKRPRQNIKFGIGPTKAALDGARATGLSFIGSPSGRLLSEPLVVEYDGRYYPSFALQVISQSQHKKSVDKEVLQLKGVRFGSSFIATDAGYQYYPRLTPETNGSQSLVMYSASDVILNRINKQSLRNSLRNKVVLVGINSTELAPISISYNNRKLVPLEWAAQVINSLLTGSKIKTPTWALAFQRVTIIGLALYLLLLPGRLRGRTGFGISIALSAGLLNSSLILLIVYSVWLPLAVPALFLITGQFFLSIQHDIWKTFRSIQGQATEAYHELASNLQSQGKYDEALKYLKMCPLDTITMDNLYNLALEFERRRQFNQAISVYDYLSHTDENFRDIKERRSRHKVVPNSSSLANSNGDHSKTVLIVDNPNVAQPILGRYEIEEVIGQGAMGTVYKGKDPKIGRTVAIKTLALSAEFESKHLDEVRRRFYREAETAGRLNHPNIVTIYDVGEEHDLAYIAMDYINGEGLENYSHHENLLPINEVFDIGIATAEALDYAHEQNVVHRDIKPANIIYNLSNKTLKLTDFGIACLTDNSRTRTGTILGSPSFMSPEQLEGKKLDGRSDLFSLGVTLYQLFTGYLPFVGESMTALAYKIANSKAASVRKARSELPSCLTRILNKALEKTPKQRYQSGEAFADALRKCKR